MTTPAMTRATEALIDRTDAYDPDELIARAVVARALHDPADPDFGARELFVADSGQDRDFALRIWFEASDAQPVKQYWRRMFDALRAAILGGA